MQTRILASLFIVAFVVVPHLSSTTRYGAVKPEQSGLTLCSRLITTDVSHKPSPQSCEKGWPTTLDNAYHLLRGRSSLIGMDLHCNMLFEYPLPGAPLSPRHINATHVTFLLAKHDLYVLMNLQTGKWTPLLARVGCFWHHDAYYNPHTNEFLGLVWTNNSTVMTLVHYAADGTLLSSTDLHHLCQKEINQATAQVDMCRKVPALTPQSSKEDREEVYFKLCMDVVHMNSVYWDMDSNLVYLNSRRLSTFFAFHVGTRQVLWSCGWQGTLRLLDEEGNPPLYPPLRERISPPFNQTLWIGSHDVKPLNQTHFLMYDNACAAVPLCDSGRAKLAIVKIDLNKGTCQRTWHFQFSDSPTPKRGSASIVPPGHVLGFSQLEGAKQVPLMGQLTTVQAVPPPVVWRFSEGKVTTRETFKFSRYYERPVIGNCLFTPNSRSSFQCPLWNSFSTPYQTNGVLRVWTTKPSLLRPGRVPGSRLKHPNLVDWPDLVFYEQEVLPTVLSIAVPLFNWTHDLVYQRNLQFNRHWAVTVAPHIPIPRMPKWILEVENDWHRKSAIQLSICRL